MPWNMEIRIRLAWYAKPFAFACWLAHSIGLPVSLPWATRVLSHSARVCIGGKWQRLNLKA